MSVITKQQAIDLAKQLAELAPNQSAQTDFEDLLQELEYSDEHNWQDIKELWHETMSNIDDYWQINKINQFIELWQQAKQHKLVQEELEQFIHSG